MISTDEPRDDAILDVVSITGLQRRDAVKWLKAYDNDANKAMDAFLENPNAILDQASRRLQSQVKADEQRGQTNWQEDHFHIDDTVGIRQNQDQSGIRPTDTLRPGVFSDSAPSRPPSRASERVTTTALANVAPNSSLGSEDEQMRRAMAISMDDSQTLPGQNLGTPDNQAFGPATRDHYESDQWAMTISAPQTQEILLNPEPQDRKRPDNRPAFLKPSPAGHRLPALIKILHAIPMAREALLNRSKILRDYGHDKDWWDGTAIKLLRVVDLDEQGSPINTNDVIYETQRLMAFLDKTERSYGSTDVLANADLLGESCHDKIKAFYSAWHDATINDSPDASLVDIFASIGTKASEDGRHSERIYCLTASTNDGLSGKASSLYDVLDQAVWGDNGKDEESFFEKLGDVFTLDITKVGADGQGLGIEVPATWYADRYLQSSTDQVKQMLVRKAEIALEIAVHETAQSRLRSRSINGVEVDSSHLISSAINYFEKTSDYQKAKADSSPNDVNLQEPVGETYNADEMIKRLNALTERISNKLKALETAKDNARDSFKQVSQIYTKTSYDPSQPPHHQYSLRGVSISSHRAYVLEQTRPDDEEDMLSTEARDWQWWKLEFISSSPEPVVVEKVTEEAVLTATKDESSSVLLVYANEAAIRYQHIELPLQLNNFIRADNLSFAKELEDSGYPQSTQSARCDVSNRNSRDADGHSLIETAACGEEPEQSHDTFDHVVPLSLQHD